MDANGRARRNRPSLPSLVGVGLLAATLAAPSCPPRLERDYAELPGLSKKVRVHTDAFGVPHIEALSLADAFRAQGYLHARDRFFQMDWNRRRAEGRLAALGGSLSHLESDGRIRLLGLRAAAQRSHDVLAPAERELLEAYAAGVNAWLTSHPLPPEYAALEVTIVEPWTALDSLLLGKALFASLNGPRLWEIGETAVFAEYVDALGEERARLLYPDELGRFAPWVPHATVPDARGTPFASLRPRTPLAAGPASHLALAHQVRARAAATGFLADALARPEEAWGSNAWGVASAHSATGAPLVAGDPHLGGSAPAVGYEVHLLVGNDGRRRVLNASGGSVPGIPAIVLGGQTSRLAWAVTAFAPDVSDVFRDRLVRDDPACPARLCIDSAGALHPVEEGTEAYRLNVPGDGLADTSIDATPIVTALAPQAVNVLRVPFRSFGPVVEVADRSVLAGGPATETTVLTLQWSGLHADRAVRWALDTLRARDVFEFERAVASLTWAGIHHVVADVEGNLGYFAGGEIPLRADLEAGAPLDGMPPWWIRDGSGAANWVPDPARSQGQMLPFAVLPREEMPRIVNPPAGFVVNCNEDPLGFAVDNDLLNDRRPSKPQAIHYLGDLGSRGLRNGRVTQMLRERIDAGHALSLGDMKRIQADTRALHAEILVPHLLAAFESAQRPGAPEPLAAFAADPRIAEAIARLDAWDFSHPTGIPEGYDASDVGGVRTPEVSAAEAEASVAATLYEVWVIKLVKQLAATITSLGLTSYVPINLLVSLLPQDPFTGVGASGVDYFPEPAALADATDRRDAVFLGVLRDTLDALPGPAYAAAFAGSTDQDDYRWGKLHRIVLPHPLGGSSIPPAGGFVDLAPTLPGLARDGTWDSVNVAAGPGLPDGANEWLSAGNVGLAAFRHVHALLHPSSSGVGVRGFAALAGGASGDPADPGYASQLPLWLTVDYHPIPMAPHQVRRAAKRVELFLPAP